jgi:hypothetical protein
MSAAMEFELERLAKEYAKRYPKEASVYDYILAFRTHGLVEILQEAEGRKIIFTNDNEDALGGNYSVSYS